MVTQEHRRRGISLLVSLSLILPCAISYRVIRAQVVAPAATPAGQPVQLTPAQIQAMKNGKPPQQPGAHPGAPGQPQPAKPGEGDKKKDEDKKKESASEIKRPEKPPRMPDPRDFDVKLDDKGRVPPFNFIGQPWPDVMQWLANISKCSLDWQELPNDYLNLTTQRAYSLDEVRDLINRHLKARGYVAIQSGEVLSVFKIEKLDPSLVRRVDEDQLYDLKPYDFVKVSFEVPADMEVEKAKDDVKQVLSPTAKIFPLVASKRLLVMDSVANLRTVSQLFNQERMVQDGRIVPKEFVLKYARPQQVIETLYVILGVDPNAKPAQTNPQMQQQQMQMLQQMQQQQHGKDLSKLLGKSDAPKVYLAYNRQRNSVLANAPPEQMKIIEQTIDYLDVPFGETTAVEKNTADSGKRRLKKYPLTTLDPEKFVSTLEEIGGLSPYAEFKIDSGSKTLFALASEADHMKISSLVDQFDGTGRHFEVIQLHRRPADAVAATIYNLMGGQEKEDEDNNNRRRYWSPWDDYGRDQDKKKPVKGFGVDADIENNQLLVWANDAEMERVHELLVKLGETPDPQRNSSRVRIIQPSDAKSTAELLKQLRAAWPSAAGNELIIKAPAAAKPVPTDDKKKESAKPAASTKSKNDRAAGMLGRGRIAAHFVEMQAVRAATKSVNADGKSGSADAEPTASPVEGADTDTIPAGSEQSDTVSDKKTTSPAPVTITVTENGRLVLSSSDTAALDRLENLIEELSPSEPRFKVFPLKYIRASEMWYDLTDYFEDDMKDDSSGYTRDWYGFMIPKGSQKSGGGLSKRRKLMITYDRPSNSILVSNASASQLADIEQLIKAFDKPAPVDSVEIRQTAAIKVQYSRPSVIAAAIKEVYRDLLSSKDKEFDRGNKQGDRSSTERMTVINYGGSSSSSDSDRPSPMKVGFDGALSLGADDVSGVLIVSAQKGIFNDIVRMVQELDEQAAPQTTVQVHRIVGNVSAEAIQKAIDKAVGKAWLGNRPEQLPTQTGPDNKDKKRGENDRNHNEQHHNSNSND